MTPEPKDTTLYQKAKDKYSSMKHSAYKSGLVVKYYKELYAQKYKSTEAYKGPKPIKTGLTAWHKQEWRNSRGNVGYEGKTNEIYRPTKKYGKTLY